MVFGPGVGECILIHLGGGRWVVVDSCLRPNTHEPVALAYLSELGLDPVESIVLVVATHWHDDHIKGLSDVFRVATKARLVLSQAMRRPEFLTFVSRFKGVSLAGGSKVAEMDRLLQIQEDESRPTLRRAEVGKTLQQGVVALSPSDNDVDRFLQMVGQYMPEVRSAQRAAPDPTQNEASVALWIDTTDGDGVLLGSDLEQQTDSESGWRAVVGADNRPQGKASVFKIPHHGSAGAHNGDVWTDMLLPTPLAALTPFSRSRLPKPNDAVRINSLTHNAFLSSHGKKVRLKKRGPAVERQLREMHTRPYSVVAALGAVQFRRKLGTPPIWGIELFGAAGPL